MSCNSRHIRTVHWSEERRFAPQGRNVYCAFHLTSVTFTWVQWKVDICSSMLWFNDTVFVTYTCARLRQAISAIGDPRGYGVHRGHVKNLVLYFRQVDWVLQECHKLFVVNGNKLYILQNFYASYASKSWTPFTLIKILTLTQITYEH